MAESPSNPAQDLAGLWSANYGRFKDSRDLITEVARWERQEVKPHLPTKMLNGKQVQQGFPVVLPHATTMAQDVAAFVARRQPSLKRTPLGEGSRADRDASKVERWLQEAFASKVKIEGQPLWEVLCSYGTHDAEYAVVVQPLASAYAGHLAFRDDEGNISAAWQRNKEGLDEDEYRAKHPRADYKVSEGKSSDAHRAYLRDYKARRWPFLVRVLSAHEYLPLGRNPLTGKLDEILIRSVCSATHLKAEGFDWWSTVEGGADERNVEGSGQQYWLYELHKSNPWRIIYQIVGLHDGVSRQSTKDGTPTQMGLDLGEEYGLTNLLAGQFWGWHRAHDKDPAKRGIPLLAPFIGTIGAANRSITGIIEHNYRTGFGGWGVEMQKDLYEVWVEMGRPTQFDLMDDSIHVLLGKPTSLVHQGVGADSWRVLEFLSGLVERFNESEGVRSSPDASSVAQTTALASTDTVLSQISGGALQAYQFTAEALLELTAVLSEDMGAPIPVYCTLNQDGEEQTHVELSAKEIMGDFTVEVTQPTKRGQNLPKAQAGVSWQAAGLISKHEWREDFLGDEQPEQGLDRIAAEQYVDSEQGQQELGVLVARIQGDRAALTIRGLQNEGKLSQGQTPTAAMPPPQSGVTPNGVPTGMPNQAAASLGGQMAAAVNPSAMTNTVTATGTGPDMAAP